MFSSNIEKFIDQVKDLPDGVAQGLHWLLSQDEALVRDFGQQLQESHSSLLHDLKDTLEKRSIGFDAWQFKQDIKEHISQRGQSIFKHPHMCVDIDSIRVTNKTKYNSSTYRMLWNLKTDLLDADMGFRVDFYPQHSIEDITDLMADAMRQYIRMFLIETWNDLTQVHKLIDSHTKRQMEAFGGLFESTEYNTDTGMVFELPDYAPVVVSIGEDKWAYVEEDHDIYKKYELARNLMK